jgi:DNA-directed RNA polymerase subunit RPC12/RpoP
MSFYGAQSFNDWGADDYSKDLLRDGIIEAKSGNKAAARRILDRAIYLSSDHEAIAEGWYWMSQVVDERTEKRKALENCLSNNLQHTRARRALAIIDGKLKPDEIVDANALPLAPERLRQADAQRFMCPKCGGRMSFSPDGESLVCDYCSRNQTLEANQNGANEKDFIVAMATARGHDKPLAEQAVHCQGCGAEFILPPDQLSAVCVYCGSPHVVNLEKSKDLIAPDGIIPHAFDQKQAAQILINWVEQNKIKPEKKVDLPRGLYLPLWTFDLGGSIDYVGEIVEEDDINLGRRQRKIVRVKDTYPLLINDLPIPASRKSSAPFMRLISTFDLKAIKAYDPRYLSNWPAELYDISMADASLDARSRTVARIKREMISRLNLTNLISASSAKMTVDAFRLNLLPVWLTEIWKDGRSHLVLFNGQNGKAQSDITSKPFSGLMEWLSDLVND